MLKAHEDGKAEPEAYYEACESIADDDKRFAQELSDHLGLKFAPRVDGEGAFYASYRIDDDTSVMVYVYPPKNWWNGDIAPTEPKLHSTLWQMTEDGEITSRSNEINGLALRATA